MSGGDPRVIAPGSTIGILGAGQLGRMTATAAAALGYRCHVYAPDEDMPAAHVSATATRARYDDLAALERFARAVDVVTFEFENVPFESVRLLAEHVPVRPGWEALRVSQDRVVEKDFVRGLGIGTADYSAVAGPAELARALDEFGGGGVLKSTRLGYDGKGQVRVGPGMDADEAWRRMGAEAGILEAFVDFDCEVSVIVARGPTGETAAYVPVLNRHRNHILDETVAPAPLPEATAADAETIARRIAEALGLIGLLAVEMFVTRDGRVLVNEIAPRPHNSGHWTIDACVTSQFEQFVRAVCGLPLGSPARLCDAVMTNLIGDDVAGWHDLLRDPAAKLHLYGKAEVRAGRKMGHVTRLRLPRPQ
ncbi:5-(carboxyamino)imidazole ribonucleotide synthase [Constrictibacter sp. MBR-5]|uniref:5-(carboxyamino)imidazole ribonucleotide synthase n=1 Tax=Constrictibacter sp. MBR-5 TaxID=3156467 RepID=UPI003391D106